MRRSLFPLLIVICFLLTYSCYVSDKGQRFIVSDRQIAFNCHIGDSLEIHSIGDSPIAVLNKTEDSLLIFVQVDTTHLHPRPMKDVGDYYSFLIMIPQFNWRNRTEISVSPEMVGIWYYSQGRQRMEIQSATFLFDNYKTGEYLDKYHLDASFSIKGTTLIHHEDGDVEPVQVYFSNGHFEFEEETNQYDVNYEDSWHHRSRTYSFYLIRKTNRSMAAIFNDSVKDSGLYVRCYDD